MGAGALEPTKFCGFRSEVKQIDSGIDQMKPNEV